MGLDLSGSPICLDGITEVSAKVVDATYFVERVGSLWLKFDAPVEVSKRAVEISDESSSARPEI